MQIAIRGHTDKDEHSTTYTRGCNCTVYQHIVVVLLERMETGKKKIRKIKNKKNKYE